MSGEVGSLTVNLGLNSAGFSGGITEAGKAARKAGQDIKAGMEEGKYSMMEARHSVMLLGEEFGVHVPRAVSTMIASIGPIGPALAAAFPLLAVAALVGIVAKVAEKHREAAIAIQKAALESENLAVKQRDQSLAMEVTNLKLDDQIAKLEHKPATNFFKEAVDENTVAVDKLAESFSADFEKIGEKIQEKTGYLSYFSNLMKQAYTTRLGFGGAVTAADDEVKSLHAVAEAQARVNQVRAKRASTVPGSQAEVAATEELRAAYKALEAVTNSAMSATYGDVQLKMQLAQGASEASNAIKDLNAQMEAGQKHLKIAGLEQAKENLIPLQQEASFQKIAAAGADAHAAALKRLADIQAELASAGKKNVSVSDKIDVIQAEEKAEVDSADSVLANKKKVYDADIAAAGDDTAKKKELDEQWKNAVQANTDAVAQFEANAALKIAAAWGEEAQKQIAIDKSAVELSDANSKLLQSQKLISIKAEEADNDASHKLLLETEKQYIAKRIELIKQEQGVRRQALQDEINQQQGLAAQQGAAGNVEGQNAALSKASQLQAQLNQETAQYTTEIKNLNTDMSTTAGNWGQYWRKMAEEVGSMQAIIADVSKEMQNDLNKAIKGFGDALAKTIVEGKSLGQAMKNVAKEIAESFISTATQILITAMMVKIAKKLMGTEDDNSGDRKKEAGQAGIAAAAGVASAMVALPFPANVTAAPAVGAGAYAEAMSFGAIGAMEQGGLVGYDDMIIAAHRNEMVLPAPLSEKVQKMTEPSKGANVHVTYSPTVHAIDGKGMGQVLNEHAQVIQAHVQKAMRRTNRG